MNLLPLLWTLLLLAVTTGIFLTAATRAKARLKKQYPPIGQKIDIGGYRLRMHAEGEGTPTVILDAGAGVIGQSISFNQRKNIMAMKLNTYRTTAKVVGVLYILGFVVGIAGSALGTPGQLDTVSARSMTIAVGALLWVIAAFGDAAHGVLMFPLLKQNSERIALGYFGARIVEAAIIAVSALFILLQIPLGAEFLKVSASETSYLQSLSTLFVQSQAYTYQIGMVALGMAGLTLCYGFYQAKLVPQFFVIWGLIGYVSFLGGSMLEILGFNLQLLHTLPGGLWEMTIGVWLIVKGFNSAKAFVSDTAALSQA